MSEIRHHLCLFGNPDIAFSLFCQYAKEGHTLSLIQYFSENFALNEDEFLEWLSQKELISRQTVADVRKIQDFDLSDIIQHVFPLSGNETHTGALKVYALLSDFVSIDKARCKRVFHYLQQRSGYLYFYDYDFFFERIPTHHVSGKEIVDEEAFTTRSSVRKLTLGQKLKLAQLMSIDEWEAFYASLEVDDTNWRENDDECDEASENSTCAGEEDSAIEPKLFTIANLLERVEADVNGHVIISHAESDLHDEPRALLYLTEHDKDSIPLFGDKDNIIQDAIETYGAVLVLADYADGTPCEASPATIEDLRHLIATTPNINMEAPIFFYFDMKSTAFQAELIEVIQEKFKSPSPIAIREFVVASINKYGAALLLSDDANCLPSLEDEKEQRYEGGYWSQDTRISLEEAKALKPGEPVCIHDEGGVAYVKSIAICGDEVRVTLKNGNVYSHKDILF